MAVLKVSGERIITEVPVRDPFVLVSGGQYYLYGTRVATCWGYADGFDVYVSDDLLHWDGPKEVFHNDGSFWADQNYWAPEVHYYQGQYYMFASFKKEGMARGTQILRAGSPLGPFVPLTDRPVTPPDWECLDGTLYVDQQDQPYIVFCHEWKQIENGTICAMRLTPDLCRAASAPQMLFDAKGAVWPQPLDGGNSYVTDGPYLWRLADKTLAMLWSSHGRQGYGQAVAVSASGEIDGPWRQSSELLFARDGGHGMLFRSLTGQLMLALHNPNETPLERAVFFKVQEGGEEVI